MANVSQWHVGLGLGYPTVATSFGSQFSIFGKLAIYAMVNSWPSSRVSHELGHAILLHIEDIVGNDTASKRKE